MSRIKQALKENKGIVILLLLMAVQRIVAIAYLGPRYHINSDDMSYTLSGMTFIETGQITMHRVLSAQIMPGMPVLVGVFYALAGSEAAMWVPVKLTWCLMALGYAWFTYKSVTLFSPKWCGLIAASFYFSPEFLWMDNLLLTETPFLFFFTALIYFTLMLGHTQKARYFVLCTASYLLALMFKANIGIYPLFAFVYLLLVKYPLKRLLKQGCLLAAALLVFIIPWSIRNYRLFDAFIPLTYGMGNPMLLGTYQGYGYPGDDLDYETHVQAEADRVFARYYDENGNVPPHIASYISLETDMIKAKYRMAVWWERNPRSMLAAYLKHKPLHLMTKPYYYSPVFGVAPEAVAALRIADLVLCVVLLLLCLVTRRRWQQAVFLAIGYGTMIMLYAITFAYARYGVTLQHFRYIGIGIGLGVAAQIIQELYARRRKNGPVASGDLLP